MPESVFSDQFIAHCLLLIVALVIVFKHLIYFLSTIGKVGSFIDRFHVYLRPQKARFDEL